MTEYPDYDCLQVSVADGVGRLLLDRPEVLNALTPEMMGEMIDALALLAADDGVRALLVTGAGRGFSAGGDAGFLEKIKDYRPFEIKDTVYSFFGKGVQALKLFPKPTVAAVNGPASGAGFEIALACDFRVVSTDAVFHQTWIHLGLISPLGGMYLLPRLVGLTLANEILMLGRRVRGEEAAEIGLVNETVAPDDLDAAAAKLVRTLAEGPPLALRAMKEGIRRGLESTLAAEWEHNVYVQGLLIDSDDYAEGVQALSEKRKARFKGR
ncbi:MAG: enoyl-CoA hydratase/isomerase family protein [Rhodospirillaceae bacterium]|jgi:enoyl-CoA hydratase/carnithine racemase|nr:enoyl-CoA hydratase/isomerase family protein [Rhodospirillaceae bacterium]MBT5193052.1 enoyl-CoA hydratase/isomerase family protein [Rhodospirillaceae bacterium]MBT5895941.1 enoyl-CoA hydratase/isomerase family protein [Rhodospirillaceae bacterium]MBT6431135.1 enoyl-CoA hydratase/isomerase family protein [Rhodospirillaceae bacterium]MBT7759167.1 enoyl-CoA hydratase/isomerase family protein [Rhodospirillaceae bacterium]